MLDREHGGEAPPEASCDGITPLLFPASMPPAHRPMVAISATRTGRLRWPLAALLALALASCGGGGGGSGSAEQAPPPPRTDPETQPGGGEPTPAVAAPTDIMITTAARALTV